MPKVADITKTQFFKIYSLLNDNAEMTSNDISDQLGMPLPSVRRILGNLYDAGRLEKKFIYRLIDSSDKDVMMMMMEKA